VTGRPLDEVLEDFSWTFEHHQGDLLVAAQRMGMKSTTLAKALYRAKRKGHDVQFFDNSGRTRNRRMEGNR
jgi:hypothetical protein